MDSSEKHSETRLMNSGNESIGAGGSIEELIKESGDINRLEDSSVASMPKKFIQYLEAKTID